jgi:nitrite reductase (NO-forming)
MRIKSFAAIAAATIVGLNAAPTWAKTVKVTLHAKETTVQIDNKGTEYPAWTFGGTIPGPLIRATQGDTVEVTFINDKENKNSHAIDMHAAMVDVLGEFAPIRPGESKTFTFVPKYPGIFMYHCGAMPMQQHIARGMYGAIIIDPKGGYSKAYPKPDREYVLVEGQYFPNADDDKAMLVNEGWTNSLINGKIFHYDPVHDPNGSEVLEAKPGERVRIYFVNANINMPVAFHPIAGIWDRVYVNGNPKNVMYGVQTFNVPVAGADVFDIVSPADHPTNNAIVDHTMSAAMRGAITVLMNKPDADPKLGKGDNILIR